MLQKRTNRRDLHGRIAVDLAGGHGAVVGAETDDIAAQATEGGDNLPGPLWLELEVVAVVADLLDDDRYVERRVEAGRRVEAFFNRVLISQVFRSRGSLVS